MEAMVAGDTVVRKKHVLLLCMFVFRHHSGTAKMLFCCAKGLVLDLVADTLSVYRNERRLGVLWTGALA